MEFDTFFWVAAQSSLILGLIHGVNPCGHSWLVLAPFTVGSRNGRTVTLLTTAFLLGTAAACLLLGLTLGTISRFIPPAFQWWVEAGTALALLFLGVVLIVKPELLHHHDHAHGHDHGHDPRTPHHAAAPTACRHSGCASSSQGARKKVTMTTLFSVGFVNMIIPCPTVAIMYKYALDSQSQLHATLVFAIYAAATAVAVAAVIFGIFRVTMLLRRLCEERVERWIMRTAGILTVFFAAYSLAQLI